MTVWKLDGLQQADISKVSLADHERYMRLAIAQGKCNEAWPFGAVIVDPFQDEVVAAGVNEATDNPIFHGEIVTLNNFVHAHGNTSLKDKIGNINLHDKIMYSTAEPCPMCMSALVWAGIGGLVFGIGLKRLVELGISQIMIEASEVCAHADFYTGSVLGGILQKETDDLFRYRPEVF